MGYGADCFQRLHAMRESEVCGALQIQMSDLCGREEGMGNRYAWRTMSVADLRMIEICRRLNMTRETGRGVEMPVFGYIGGEMVTGRIVSDSKGTVADE